MRNAAQKAASPDLEHRRRVVARSAGLLGDDAVEAERREIEYLDEGVNHTNRVLLADVVLDRLGQQRCLPPIRTLCRELYEAVWKRGRSAEALYDSRKAMRKGRMGRFIAPFRWPKPASTWQFTEI